MLNATFSPLEITEKAKADPSRMEPREGVKHHIRHWIPDLERGFANTAALNTTIAELPQRHRLHTINKIFHHISLNQASHPPKQDTGKRKNMVQPKSDQPRITEEI